MTVYLLAAIVGVLGALVATWPSSTINATTAVHILRISFRVDPDQRLFLVVGLAGGLGGLVHSARSLYWYVGNRRLTRSWLVMYISLPFVGAALAVVFYLVLRGGLLPSGSGASSVNVFGFAATSALVGLFTPQAARKLQQVFDTLLTPAEKGRDQAPADEKDTPPQP